MKDRRTAAEFIHEQLVSVVIRVEYKYDLKTIQQFKQLEILETHETMIRQAQQAHNKDCRTPFSIAMGFEPDTKLDFSPLAP